MGLLIQAHEQRLFELLGDDHIPEALQLYQTTLKTHPDWKSHLSYDVRVNLECHGAPLDLLVEYEEDSHIKSQVNESLRRILIAPDLLVNHELLPRESSLRQEAETLMSAWTAVESAQDEEGLRKLRSISRKSPFNHWRLFIQALSSFYRNDDRFAKENIRRISSDSAVYPAANLLQALMDRDIPRKRFAKTVGENINKSNIKWRLENMDSFIHAGNHRKAKEELVDICRELTKDGQGLLGCDLMASFIMKAYDGDWCDDFLSPKAQSAVNDFESVILRVQYHLDDDDKESWIAFMETHKKALSKLEKALIYRRLAHIEMRTYQCPDGPYKKRPSKSKIKDKVNAYYSQSVAIHPLPETYKTWHSQFKSMQWNVSRVLAKWHQDFPEDEEALLFLLNESRRKQAVVKVETYFKRLKSLLKGSPRLMELEPYIKLERAIFTLKRKKAGNLDEIIDSVPTSPVQIAIGRTCLKWVYGPETNQTEKEIRSVLAEYESPCLVYYNLCKIDGHKNWFSRLPQIVKSQFKNAEMLIQSLLTVYRLNDERWNMSGMPWLPFLNKALLSQSLSSGKILELLSVLRERYSSFNVEQVADMALRLTVNGLKRTDIPKADMFTYRALIYHGLKPQSLFAQSTYQERISNLLSAAKFYLSKEQGDSQLYQETAYFISPHKGNDDIKPLRKKFLEELAKFERQIDSVEKLRLRMKKRQKEIPSTFPFSFNFEDMDVGSFEGGIFGELLRRFGGFGNLDLDDFDEEDGELNSPVIGGLPNPSVKPSPTSRRKPPRPPKYPVDHPEFPNLF